MRLTTKYDASKRKIMAKMHERKPRGIKKNRDLTPV